MGIKIQQGLCRTGKAIILFIFSLFTVFPFIWMLLSALKTKQEIMDVSAFFPETFQWHNFYQVIFESPLLKCGKQFIYIGSYNCNSIGNGGNDNLCTRIYEI